MDDDSNDAEIVFDWDATSMTAACNKTSEPSLRRFEEGDPMTLLTYALPHHMDTLNSSVLPENSLYCISSITGPACLVEGSTWSILENLPRIAFQAPRPPRPHFLPALTQVLLSDINYTLPDFFQRGAGDTYFSGKMLAKLGRILLIAEEVEELCHGNKGGRQHSEYVDFCLNSTLPSAEQLSSAVDRLRSGVEIWINGTADTPFVYDVAWGGVVSCGCQFNEDGCDNRAPDCPAFFDHGLNFGNGTNIA